MNSLAKIDPQKRQSGHLLTVKHVKNLTPNMLRVTLHCPSLTYMYSSRQGAHCKLLIPQPEISEEAFRQIISVKPSELSADQRPIRRTYTVRHFRKKNMEMDIDFVNHGDEGPASSWARHAIPGSFIGLLGPALPKIKEFYADWYLVAADMSALPLAAATIEAMPKDAKGVAIFEITTAADKQIFEAPESFEINWILHSNPHKPSINQLSFFKNLDWPKGIVQTCIAGESGLIKQLRHYLNTEKDLPKKDAYISGYWKIGLVEDEHRTWKNNESKLVG